MTDAIASDMADAIASDMADRIVAEHGLSSPLLFLADAVSQLQALALGFVDGSVDWPVKALTRETIHNPLWKTSGGHMTTDEPKHPPASKVTGYAHLVVNVSADTMREHLANVDALRAALEPFTYRHAIVTDDPDLANPILRHLLDQQARHHEHEET